MTVGKMSDHNGDVDRGMLLSKLQALILRLDRTNVNRQIPSVESATDYLQEVCHWSPLYTVEPQPLEMRTSLCTVEPLYSNPLK